MQAVRKVISCLLLLIIAPMLMGQVAALAARNFLDDPARIKVALREGRAGDQIERYLVGQLDGNIPLERQEIETLVQTILPMDDLERLTDQMVDGTHAWIWSGESHPEIMLDLSPIRARVRETVRTLVHEKAAALPVCSAVQLLQVIVTYQGGMPPCKLPQESMNRGLVNLAVDTWQPEQYIPNQIDMAEILERSNPGAWYDLRFAVSNVRFGFELLPWVWGIIGLFVALLAVLNLDRWYTPFGWVAASLILGALPLFFAAAVAGLPVGILPRLGGWLDVAQALFEAFRTVLWQTSLSLLVIGGVCVLVVVGGRMYEVRSGGGEESAA